MPRSVMRSASGSECEIGAGDVPWRSRGCAAISPPHRGDLIGPSQVPRMARRPQHDLPPDCEPAPALQASYRGLTIHARGSTSSLAEAVDHCNGVPTCPYRMHADPPDPLLSKDCGQRCRGLVTFLRWSGRAVGGCQQDTEERLA